MWHIAQQAPEGTWGDWTLLNGVRLQPGFAVTQNADGRLELIGFGPPDGPLDLGAFAPHRPGDEWWSISQITPGGAWGVPVHLGRTEPLSQLVAGSTADHRTQVFAVDTNGEVWSNWQSHQNGQWNGWVDFGGTGLSLDDSTPSIDPTGK